MDPSDRLEEDFQFYLSFYEQNLKELRNEKDKALCQEWLERLDGMRGTRKQRRDRNVYLSQLALAMAEGQLVPPFSSPPPREPLPMPASLFEMFRAGVTVVETPEESKSEISPPSANADTSGENGSNFSFRSIKGKWALNSLQESEKSFQVHGKVPTTQSETSSPSITPEKSENHQSNGNISRAQVSDEIVCDKPQVNQTVTPSSSASADSNGKHRTNGNINRDRESKIIFQVNEKTPTNPSEMLSPSAKDGTRRKHQLNGNSNRRESTKETVHEKPQENQPRTSSLPARDVRNEKHRTNGNTNRVQVPKTTVHEKPQENQPRTSSLPARDVRNEEDRTNGNTNRVKDPKTTVYQKPQKNLSEIPTPSKRVDISGKHSPNNFTKEKCKRSINGMQAAGENVKRSSQTTLSEISSLGSLSDTSVQKWLSTNYKEDESKLSLYSPDEFVPQMMLFKIPFSYTSSETSTETGVHYKSSRAEDFVSSKSPTLKSGTTTCISFSDFNEEKVDNNSENNKPSNEMLPTVGEKELHSRKLSDSETDVLQNYKTNTVKNKQQQQPELLSKKPSDSWTKLIPSSRYHSEKKLDFQRPEHRPVNYSYYDKCVLSGDKLHSEDPLDYQNPEHRPVNYSYYDKCVLSGDKLNSEDPLVYQNPDAQSTNFFDSRINVLSKRNFNPNMDHNLQRPVISRTCPRPSQMPLVEEKLESQSTNDGFVTSDWEDIATEDEAVSHVDSLDSLISYSKGQWLDPSCDSESFLSTFSVLSGMSEDASVINCPYDSPSVQSDRLQKIRMSEREIQSISFQSLPDQSRKSTPALSLTSVVSKGQQKYSPSSAAHSVKDQYTQTQSKKHLPQEKSFHRKPVLLPVYIVSEGQPPILAYTPLTASQIQGRKLIIPNASQMRTTSSQVQQQRILRTTPKQGSKINARVHFS